jgi:hypothetical protein
MKAAYSVMLEDGTEIVASAEHQFLTRLDWKHVVGAESGPLRGPYLTCNNKLLDPGGFVTHLRSTTTIDSDIYAA